MALPLKKLLELAQFAEKDNSLIVNHVNAGVFKDLAEIKKDLEMLLGLHKDQQVGSGDELFTKAEFDKIESELKQVESLIMFYTSAVRQSKEKACVA